MPQAAPLEELPTADLGVLSVQEPNGSGDSPLLALGDDPLSASASLPLVSGDAAQSSLELPLVQCLRPEESPHEARLQELVNSSKQDLRSHLRVQSVSFDWHNGRFRVKVLQLDQGHTSLTKYAPAKNFKKLCKQDESHLEEVEESLSAVVALFLATL